MSSPCSPQAMAPNLRPVHPQFLRASQADTVSIYPHRYLAAPGPMLLDETHHKAQGAPGNKSRWQHRARSCGPQTWPPEARTCQQGFHPGHKLRTHPSLHNRQQQCTRRRSVLQSPTNRVLRVNGPTSQHQTVLCSTLGLNSMLPQQCRWPPWQSPSAVRQGAGSIFTTVAHGFPISPTKGPSITVLWIRAGTNTKPWRTFAGLTLAPCACSCNNPGCFGAEHGPKPWTLHQL